jgi:hypothetical protein
VDTRRHSYLPKKLYIKPAVERVSLRPAATTLAECWSTEGAGVGNISVGACGDGGIAGCINTG